MDDSPSGPPNKPMQCSFCCVDSQCNQHAVPQFMTLYGARRKRSYDPWWMNTLTYYVFKELTNKYWYNCHVYILYIYFEKQLKCNYIIFCTMKNRSQNFKMHKFIWFLSWTKRFKTSILKMQNDCVLENEDLIGFRRLKN